jgi:predicted secreted protein
MRFGTGLAVYFVIWWIVLFAILPIRIRTQAEGGHVVPGTEASAPERPRLLLKAGLTTIVAGVVFLGLQALFASGLGLDDIPFLPRYDR